MRHTVKCFLFFFVLIAAKSEIALAQQVINGKVVSGKGSIPGVLVVVVKTALGTTTDIDGGFIISGKMVGKYTLRLTHIGFDTVYKQISFSSQDTVDAGIVNMRENSRQLKEVSLVGKHIHGSTQEALSLTRKSSKIETIISREGMQKMPDKNVAEAVQRVAGAKMVRNKGEGNNISLRGTPGDWTATLVNGDRLPTADEDNPSRTFAFTVFPANLVDDIYITRTVTPDIEADNIGGAINFHTIDFPEKRTLKINVGGGQNLIANKKLYDLNFIFGDVSRNKKFSYTIAASDYMRPYGADAFQLVYGSPFNHGINKVELKDYFGERTTIGTNAAVQFKPNDKFNIGAHFMHGRMDDNKYQYRLSYNYSDGSGQRIRMLGTHGLLERRMYGADITSEYNLTPKLNLSAKVATYSNSFRYGKFPFSDKNDIRNGYVTYDFISNSLLQFTDMVITDFFGRIPDPNNPNSLGGPIKLIGADNPYGNGDTYKNIRPVTDIPVTNKDFHFYQVFSEYNQTIEKDPVVAQFNGTYLLSDKVKIKVGIKGKNKEGSRDLSLYKWIQQVGNPVYPSAPMPIDKFELQDAPRNSTFLSEMGNDYKNKLVPFLTPNQMGTLLQDLGDTLRAYAMNKYNQDNRLWVGGHYKYTEITRAGYAMAEASLGKRWKVAGGMRVEYTRLHETSDTLNVDSLHTYKDTTGSYYTYFEPESRTLNMKYFSFLPSLNADFSVNEQSELRMAVSRTLHRPNFEETKPGAPIYYLDKQELYLGNAQLKPTYSLNFDATYQIYSGKKDLFTIGGYYKHITNHILSAITDSSQDDVTGLMIQQYINASKSFAVGVEASADKHFDFLTGFWSGFGICGNITYSYSRMYVPGRPKSQAMTEQTPLMYNVALYYERKRVSTRIALNYTGPYLVALNLVSLSGVGLVHKDTDFDKFMGEYYSLDYQLSVKINNHFNVYGEINNLLDAPYITYIGHDWRPRRIEYYHQRVQVGLKFEL